jgi:putative NIF3 family GTP cyclohydrolase 1 type 2
VETIFPEHEKGRIITSLLQAHPYEEVAYDIYPLENKYPGAGAGMIGELDPPADEKEFLSVLRETFGTGCIRHSELLGRPVRKVALCGGAGSYLLRTAIAAGADVFVSGDFKYHQFFDADGKIVIADIGHYESEQFTGDLIYDLILENFPKFAVRLSAINTNPIKYL